MKLSGFLGGRGERGTVFYAVIWAQERKLRVSLSRVSSSFLHLAC